MSVNQETIDNLPSMEDFEEGSSLIIEEVAETPKVNPPEGETTEEREAREAREAEEAEEAERARIAEEKAEKEEADRKAAEAKKAKEEKESKSKSKASEEESEEEEEEEEENDASTFYKDVQNLTGIELDVDYGDIDPLTPEGVALREQALAQAAINSQMEYLAENFPKEFKVLEHAVNGGSVDDLFKPGYVDYSKIELKEDDVDQHKKLLKDYYLETGISERKAELLIEADEDSDGGTFKAAQDVLKQRITQQENKQKEILEKQKAEADRLKAQDDKMRNTVSDISNSGKVGNFQIPKAEQGQFAQYALSNIRRTGDGTYSFVVPLDDKNLDSVLQQAYFSFKKGDLSKLVSIKAQTQQAQRLKAKVSAQGGKKQLKGSEAAPRTPEETKLATLEDFTVDE